MKAVFRLLPFALIAALLCACLCFPRGKRDISAQKIIIEVWNVDTFEGGKGSRTSFLNSVSRTVDEDEVYFYILSYTKEGAESAFERGIYPDMLTYGLGLDGIAERCVPLPYAFAGGQADGKNLAVPWAAGGYFLFSMTDNFTEKGETAISIGGENLAPVAAYFHDVKGVELASQEAYTRFLNGEFRYLLGTQRDVCRFASRGVTVYTRPLTEYNDLFLYISILSSEKKKICLRLVEALLSDATQGRLSEIGFHSPASESAVRTANVFTTAEGRERLLFAARENDGKFLEKYLKSR